MQPTFLSKAPIVEKYRQSTAVNPSVFSIIIPTWNNLVYLQTCVSSIRKNSRYSHQIIIHVNDGSDGSLEWVKSQGLDYTYSSENIGICYAVNIARTLASTELLVYFNDDMYACPDWDFWLHEEIRTQDTPYYYISSTMIEPRESGNACAIAPLSFGNHPDNFDEPRLLQEYSLSPKEDWSGATWPPSIVHATVWDMVGGFSTEFSPGMYSDPDFSMKLWELGVRHFKGVGKSRVYHFMSKSTGKITYKKNGRHLFLLKWGMTSNVFTEHYLQRGQPWQQNLAVPDNLRIRWSRWLSRLKRRFI